MTGQRILVLAALAVISVLVLVSVTGGDGEEHTVRATFTAAGDVIPGIEVRSAGQEVGRVKSVDVGRDGKVDVVLKIDDEIWPLPAGARVRPRLGSSIAYSGRWIALDLPRTSRGTVPEGGDLEADSAVEVDELLSAFDEETRADLGDTVKNTSATLDRSRKGLIRTIDRTPAALGQVNGLLRELTANEVDLHSLLVSTDRVVDAMVTSDGGIDEILRGAAVTFAATNDRSQRLEELLVRTPPLLRQARGTLGRAESTLTDVRTLARRLDPGVRSLRRAAAPLNGVLRTLTDVTPTARATLRTARISSPALSTLLDRLRTMSPTIRSVADQAGEQLACIRPYAPEIAGMASTWTSFLAYGDARDKYARAVPTALPFPNALPVVPPSIETLVNVAFPRPPGANIGQPWYLPECGVPEGVLSAKNDPEMGSKFGGGGK